MRAMVLHQAGMPLQDEVVADPLPGLGQVLVKVAACGVCRTDLHVVDGDLTDPKLPIIPGHEIVGHIAALGPGVSRFRPGDRVGIPLARAHLRSLQILPGRRREPVRCAKVYRLPDRRRICRVRGGGGRLLLCAAGSLRRCRGRTAPFRRIDRLPVAQAGGSGCPPGLIRIWRRGPHRGAGGAGRGASGLWLYAPRG